MCRLWKSQPYRLDAKTYDNNHPWQQQQQQPPDSFKCGGNSRERSVFFSTFLKVLNLGETLPPNAAEAYL